MSSSVVLGSAHTIRGAFDEASLDAPGARERALEKARACGYADTVQP